MYWVVISFTCTLSGCQPLPPVEFKQSAPASYCRELRNAMVKPDLPIINGFWIEAYCALRSGEP